KTRSDLRRTRPVAAGAPDCRRHGLGCHAVRNQREGHVPSRESGRQRHRPECEVPAPRSRQPRHSLVSVRVPDRCSTTQALHGRRERRRGRRVLSRRRSHDADPGQGQRARGRLPARAPRGALRAVAATARQATGDQPSLTAAWASVHWDEKAFRAMSNQQALLVFLRALLAAKKSLALYPPTSEAATAWIERLRRSLDDAFRQGLIFPIRVGRDRFTWAGGELPTTDPALKGLRFEMQSRGIAELSIEPSVENWELQAMLEVLNKPVKQFASITAARNYLRDRAVVRVSVGAPGLAGLPAPPGNLDVGCSTGTEESGSGPILRGTGADTLD